VLPIKADGLRLVPPSDPQTVGWWSDGALPGAERGTAILAGHTVSTGGGVFNDLDQIRPGQRVKILSDSHRLRLRVTSVNIYHKTVLAEHAAEIFDQNRQGRLALVSCDDWTGTDYLSNVVVIARPTALNLHAVGRLPRIRDIGRRVGRVAQPGLALGYAPRAVLGCSPGGVTLIPLTKAQVLRMETRATRMITRDRQF